MAEKIEICRVGEARYDELMEVMNLSFGFVQEDSVPFLQLLPKLYKRQYRPWDNNVCLLENDRIMAEIGLYYSQLNVCGDLLKVGGIGNVCVHPDARGKGYMKAALNAAVDEMKYNGTDFSILDGQRQRYQYFGYDHAGYALSFRVDRRNIRHVYGADYVSPLTSVPIGETDDEAALLVEINDRLPVHAVRDPASVCDLLHSWTNRAFKLQKDGETVGYYVVGGDDFGIAEFGVISPSYIRDAVAEMVLSRKEQAAGFCVPAYYTEYCDFLSSLCSGVSMNGTMRISVYQYQRVLSALFKAKAMETALPDASAVVLIHGIRADECIQITVKDHVPTVTATEKSPDLELSHIEAAAFFFGFYSPERRLAPSLAPCLPVPAVLLSPDHV